MKHLLALFVFLFCAAPAAAQNVNGCDRNPDVPINITPVFDEPRYDLSHDLTAIQQIASDRQHSIPQYHSVAMGITRYEPVLEFRVPVVVKTPPHGIACAYVQRVDVKIGYRDVTVFVANEIQQGSCGFDETIAHEQKHIAVNREILEKFAPLIEQRFKSYVQLNSAFQVDSAANTENFMQEKLQSIMRETIDQMDTENILRQREIDSPEEYNRLAQVCNGDISRLATQFLETRK